MYFLLSVFCSCAGKRILSLTDSDYVVLFIPQPQFWVMPLYWEEEEENHRKFAVNKQLEKRLRSKEILTLEVQRREADQLKQLQSEFKSEIERERNRQDKNFKKMIIQDEAAAPFKLNEVQEISCTDGKSVHYHPTITIGVTLNLGLDDSSNVLVESEKFKITTKAKNIYLFHFRSDKSF
eukprot:g2906.t1